MARAAKREEIVAKRRKVMEAEDGHDEEKELLFGLVEDDKVYDPREEYVDAFDEHENDSEGAWRRVAMASGCKYEPERTPGDTKAGTKSCYVKRGEKVPK